MSKFNKKKKGMAPINTASLPDIVFMLLFFFMVATTLRETTILVKNQLPNATEVKKLEEKRLIMTIYVGEAGDLEHYGPGDKIQLNDKIATIRDVKRFIDASRKKVPEEDQSYMTTLIKGDVNSSVGTINDVKKELREVNALKITYATRLAQQ